MSTNASMNEGMVYIYTYIYTHNGIIFSHKMNEILSMIATWVALEVIAMSKITWTQRHTARFPLICGN